MKINLLPWRDELRKVKKRQFFQFLSISVFGVVLLCFVLHYTLHNLIAQQQKYNVMTEQHLAQFASSIIEVKNLQNQIQQLNARLQVINKANTESMNYVRLFNEIKHVIPRGVELIELQGSNKEFILVGLAQANANATALNQNLNALKSIHEAKLVEIKIAQEAGLYRYQFVIKAEML